MKKTVNDALSLTKGYKQTEVGLIPEDWGLKELDQILTFGSGQDYKHLLKGDIPVYGTGGIMTYVNEYLYEGESVGIGRKGTIDKPVFLSEKFWTVDTLFYSHSFKNAIPKFIYYNFLLIKWKEYNEASGVPSLNKNTIGKIKIPLPPTLTEQKAIATALSDVDELIANLDKLITKKKAIKQGAMQQLLTPPHKGGKRIDGFNGDWVEKSIGKIGATYGGLSGKSKNDFENGNYPYITFLNVMYNTVIDTSIFEYVKIGAGEQQNQTRNGDLFFNTSSETPEEVGMCAYLNEDIHNLYLNSFCFGFRLKEESEVDGLFFSYLINSSIGRKLFLSLAQGATRYNLSKSNFNKLFINVPNTKKEQKAIAQILTDMDVEIEQLETKKAKYQNIKQGMMQELLTGKIRLV